MREVPWQLELLTTDDGAGEGALDDGTDSSAADHGCGGALEEHGGQLARGRWSGEGWW